MRLQSPREQSIEQRSGPRFNPWAVWSLILVVLAPFVAPIPGRLVPGYYPPLVVDVVAFLAMAVAGIVCGHKGRHQVTDKPTEFRGGRLATTALVLGYPVLIIGALFSALLLVIPPDFCANGCM